MMLNNYGTWYMLIGCRTKYLHAPFCCKLLTVWGPFFVTVPAPLSFSLSFLSLQPVATLLVGIVGLVSCVSVSVCKLSHKKSSIYSFLHSTQSLKARVSGIQCTYTKRPGEPFCVVHERPILTAIWRAAETPSHIRYDELLRPPSRRSFFGRTISLLKTVSRYISTL